MRVALVTVLAAFLIAACGKSDEECRDIQNKCDRVAADIARAAALRGIASEGVCSSSNPQIQKDFAQACITLKDCQDEYADGCD